MTALIEFVCRVHTEPRGAGPLITPVDGGWGYCEGYGSSGHKWTPHRTDKPRAHCGRVPYSGAPRELNHQRPSVPRLVGSFFR